MPNKTIYVSDEDVEVFATAQELTGGNLSAAIAKSLRRFVDAELGVRHGYEEVTVWVGSGPAKRAQRFVGVLIADWQTAGEGSGYDQQVERLAVYRTAKDRFALHRHSGAWIDVEKGRGPWRDDNQRRMREQNLTNQSVLEVFDSVEDLEPVVPAEFYQVVAERADKPTVENLDI